MSQKQSSCRVGRWHTICVLYVSVSVSVREQLCKGKVLYYCPHIADNEGGGTVG